jgi:hypothetical protein
MRRVSLLILIVLCFFMAGCGSKAEGSYTVSGRITEYGDPQLGLEGVTISFSGGYGTATTDTSGNWSKAGLKGTVTVTPAKDGLTFDPSSRDVTKAISNVDFAAEPIPFPIEFDDPNFEAAIRREIRKPDGQIMSTDVRWITCLQPGGCNISELGGIEHLINLSVLSLATNRISDISALAGLRNLEYLLLSYNQISDISALALLSNLRDLAITDNQISDISALVANPGLGDGDRIDIRYNRLDLSSGSDAMRDINTLLQRGVRLEYRPQLAD